MKIGASIVKGAKRVWVFDPIDGTGEYVDDGVPDGIRTSCVGVSLFVGGHLVLSAVRNPFRKETFTAQRGRAAQLNGRRIACSTHHVERGVPYDYSYWSSARFDVRELERTLGQPRNAYSAIYQACEVAAGRSAFAIFPGETIHDIAPGALIVEMSKGGVVTDLRGQRLNWRNLSHGVIYASQTSHHAALSAVRAL